MKRKSHGTRTVAARSRAVVAAPASRGGVLRAVLLAAVASGAAACDPMSPRDWPGDLARAARRVGVFLHVIEEPISLAGAEPAVHPLPAPSASATTSAAPATQPSVDP